MNAFSNALLETPATDFTDMNSYFEITDESDIFKMAEQIRLSIPKPILEAFEAMIEYDSTKAQLIQKIVSRHHMNVVRVRTPALLKALSNTVANIRRYVPGSKHPIPTHILVSVEVEKDKLVDSISKYIRSRAFEIEALTVLLDKIPKAHSLTLRLMEEGSFMTEIDERRINQTGKAGDRMIQNALDAYFSNVLHGYNAAFEALKKRIKSDIVLATTSAPKTVSGILSPAEAANPVAPVKSEIPKSRGSLKKLARVSARMETVLLDPKKIREGELENHMKHAEPTDADCPDTKILRESIREKFSAIESRIRSNALVFAIDSDSAPAEMPSIPEAPVEITPEQALVLEEIRLLKQHVGNPSSTRVTNMNSFADGRFWFKILNPFLNFLTEHIAKHPDDARNFDWRNIAQVYSQTFSSEPRLRAWCLTLAQETNDSGDFATEWVKLPRLLRAQLNQGEFKKKFGKDPMKILCGLLDGYFEGRITE